MVGGNADPRILAIARGHPNLNPNEASMAAYGLYWHLTKRRGWRNVFFLGLDYGPGAREEIRQWSGNEYVWQMRRRDQFFPESANPAQSSPLFRAFLNEISPDAIIFHQSFAMPCDIVEMARQAAGKPRIALCLHDYGPICARNGLLLDKFEEICAGPEPDKCAACLEGPDASSLWLRGKRFRHYLASADAVACASEYARRAFAKWGLDSGKIHILENVPADEGEKLLPPLLENERKNSIGFIGEATFGSGLHILLEALENIPAGSRHDMRLIVHAWNFESQPAAYQERINSRRRKLEEERALEWRGMPELGNLGGFMDDIDWLAIPSLWPESRPWPISLAFAARLPILYSHCGALKENLRPGGGALAAKRNDATDWALLMREAADAALWTEVKENMPPKMDAEKIAESCLRLLGFGIEGR